MRKNIADFLSYAVKVTYDGYDLKKSAKEYGQINNKCKTSYVLNLFHIFCNMLTQVLTQSKKYGTSDEFFSMFTCFAKLGDEMATYMVKKKLIGRLFDIHQNGHSLNKYFRKCNDVPFNSISSTLGGPQKHGMKEYDASDA